MTRVLSPRQGSQQQQGGQDFSEHNFCGRTGEIPPSRRQPDCSNVSLLRPPPLPLHGSVQLPVAYPAVLTPCTGHSGRWDSSSLFPFHGQKLAHAQLWLFAPHIATHTPAALLYTSAAFSLLGYIELHVSKQVHFVPSVYCCKFSSPF